MRTAVVKRSEMIDPRLEPNFGFDFLDQNRLDSVEFDSQGRVEGEQKERIVFITHTTLCDLVILSFQTE